MQTVGIDIGTTTISGVVLEKTEHKNPGFLKQKTIENGSFLTTTKDWERIQDAEKIVKKSRQMLDDFLTNIRKWKNRTYRADAWDRLYRQRRNLCQSVVYLAGCERKSL